MALFTEWLNYHIFNYNVSNDSMKGCMDNEQWKKIPTKITQSLKISF